LPACGPHQAAALARVRGCSALLADGPRSWAGDGPEEPCGLALTVPAGLALAQHVGETEKGRRLFGRSNGPKVRIKRGGSRIVFSFIYVFTTFPNRFETI